MHGAVGFFWVCSCVIGGISGGFCPVAGGVSCERAELPPVRMNNKPIPARVRRMARAMLLVCVPVLRSRGQLYRPRVSVLRATNLRIARDFYLPMPDNLVNARDSCYASSNCLILPR